MADMMRSRSWVVASRTYGTDYSGDYRARSKREAQALIEESQEDIEEDSYTRWCQWSLSRVMPPEFDLASWLESYGIPAPGCRMPE
jgi:hypothetical protein